MNLRLVKYFDEWQFLFPEKMDGVFNEYCEAIDFLGYDEKECQKRLDKIIKEFPESHLDAYNHISISYRNQGKIKESFQYALTSYLLGKNAFPKEFNQKEDEIRWINLDNRPFLRACQNLGLEYQYKKNLPRAIELFEENLLYNTNDNQGIRYLLLECYLELKDYTKFKTLLDRHKDDYSVEFLYGRVIYDLIKSEGKKTKMLLNQAIKCNKFIPEELAKEKHIKPAPYRIPGEPHFDARTPIGSIQEAYNYWERNKIFLNQKRIRDFFKNLKN